MPNTKFIGTTQQEVRLIHAMHALGDTTRYKLFKLLLNEDNLCVSEIASLLNVSTPAVSQHFRTFELVGLVEKERMGQKICYMLKKDDKFVNDLISLITERVK